MTGPAGGPVLVVAEQLRRAVPGGVGTYAAGLLSGLAERGAEDPGAVPVTVAASRAPRGGPDPLGRFGFPVWCWRLPGPMLTRAWDRGWSPAPAGFPVVHAVSLAVPPVPAGSRLCVFVHDLAWRSHPEATTERGRRWHEQALGRALERADLLMVPSAPVGDQLMAAGVGPERLRVVPEGADHLEAPDHQGAARLLAGLGVEGPFLLTVGTLEPRKNLGRLLEAYRRARPDLPAPWPLVVVGPSGWGDDGLGQPVPGVVVAGRVDGPVLSALYAATALFAYVPLTEGFGLPPLEAMASGACCLVADTVPSVPAAGPGQPAVARRVDPLDVDAMAGALVALAADDAGRAALAQAGRRLAAGHTWRAVAAAHVALWDQLADGGTGR